jgi:hypothetical protein
MRTGLIRGAPAALAAVAIAVLLFAPGASAKTALYVGEGVNLKGGQTKGLPILLTFELHGRGCPSGPHCFDHATVSKFGAVSWAYPNCREVLDSAFELSKSARVERGAPHAFSLSGPNDEYAQDHVTIDGRFLRHGRAAKGTFTVTDSGCSTDVVHWTASLEKPMRGR